MKNEDRKSSRSSPSTVLNIVMTLIAVTTAALSAGYFIGQLNQEVAQVPANIAALEERLSKVVQTESDALEERLSDGQSTAARRIASLEELLPEAQSATNERIAALESGISDGQSTTARRIASLEELLPETQSATNERIATLESGLSDVQSDAAQRIAALESGLSDVRLRVPILETELSRLSDKLASDTFDTAYVFRHTFDFPNPPFDVDEEEARALICRQAERSATDEFLDEKEIYRKELAAFDDSVDLKFYTMGRGEDGPVQTMIRQETACYKRSSKRGRQDDRVTPAPVEIVMQAESAIDRDDNRGVYFQPYNPSFDHNDGDSKTFPFSGLPNHVGLQVHSLTATVVDRKDPNRRSCKDYEIKAATKELDRCDFEIFVFAYLNSPPLTVTEE